MRAQIERTAFKVSGERQAESVDRNKAIGYLIARAMAAEVLGNKERCKAFTEAAQILKAMPPSGGAEMLQGANRSPGRPR